MAPHPNVPLLTASGLIAAGLVGALSLRSSATLTETPVELGTIRWTRSFEAAKTLAKESKRDLLMLFQEVPG